MALTRPRASQIYDIDYKQATRVITVSNITLSGGAPSQVDGVNLSLDDRVLVTGQSSKAQNGIYFVDTVGSGSNGTWVRSSDTNATGELLAGTIVMVTEGLIYADTQWKLVTNDPIVIGVSELIFEQNSAFAFGNVYANGTAVLANTVGDVLTLTPGDNISITGNNTSKTVTIGVTGISLNSISNGTSNVNVVSSGGNVTVGVAGTSNVAVFNSAGANITGTLGVSGNVTGGNLITAGQVVATGNATVGNITATIGNFTTFNSSQGGNVTGTLIATSSNAQFFNQTNGAGYVTVAGYLTTVGNITGGNVISNAVVIATGNVTGGNLITAGQVTATSNVAGGNLVTTGNITATGNISGGNILGNGYNLTGISTFKTIAVSGGDSAVADSIADTLTFVAGDGILITADAGNATITFTNTSVESIFATGGDMGLVTQAATDEEDLGSVTTVFTESYDLGVVAQQFAIEGNLSGNLVGNTYSINDLATLEVLGSTTTNTLLSTGNVSGGNLTTAGRVVATGNVTGGNLTTAGTLYVGTRGEIYDDGNFHIHCTSSGDAIWINTNAAQLNLLAQATGGGSVGTGVGIGTSSLTGFVTIQGVKSWTTASSYGYLINSATPTGQYNGGSQTISDVSLYANGRLMGIEIDALSDERAKNIQGNIPLDDALTFVKEVDGILYTWNRDAIEGNDTGLKSGFSAQRVHKAGFGHMISMMPNDRLAETTDEDGWTSPDKTQLAMNYSQAIPYHHEVIKHLLDRIEQLEAIVAKLTKS